MCCVSLPLSGKPAAFNKSPPLLKFAAQTNSGVIIPPLFFTSSQIAPKRLDLGLGPILVKPQYVGILEELRK